MIDERIKQIMEQNKGYVVILAGSDSDDKPKKEGELSHIEKIAKSIQDFGIPYDVRICSAHKQPVDLMHILMEYNKFEGPIAFVAVAGGTDALSGTASYHSYHPVISCPPDAPNQSCLTNPPGSCNAYIANPSNVGKFIAQMFSSNDPALRRKILDSNMAKIASLEEADKRIRQKYQDRQGGK